MPGTSSGAKKGWASRKGGRGGKKKGAPKLKQSRADRQLSAQAKLGGGKAARATLGAGSRGGKVSAKTKAAKKSLTGIKSRGRKVGKIKGGNIGKLGKRAPKFID